LRRTAGVLERLARLPCVHACHAHRVVRAAGCVFLAERVAGLQEEGIHLRRRRGACLAAGEAPLTLAARLLEAWQVLTLGRAQETGRSLVAAVPGEERAAGAEPADIVLTGAAGVRGAALAAVHVHTGAADWIDAVVRAGVVVVATGSRERVD